jgi:hypothetical protein
MGKDCVPARDQSRDQIRMLGHAHAAEEEGRLGAGRGERRDQMRRAFGRWPIVEGDRDPASCIDATDDRRPLAEGEAKGNQGSASARTVSVTAALRSPNTAR